jgi:D-arabinonate dehydratase/D-galactarolactone cycloisomerase
LANRFAAKKDGCDDTQGVGMRISSVEVFQLQPRGDMPRGGPNPGARSAVVIIRSEDGRFGIGEATPMYGGLIPLVILKRHLAPELVGKNVFDHAVLLDRLFHKYIKISADSALTAAIAALDIAFWDLKGKLFGEPIFNLLGGAWRKSIPYYASLGGCARMTVAETERMVAGIVAKHSPGFIKIRLDGDRSVLDADVTGDIEKIRAVRKLLGDAFPIAFDASNGYSPGRAIRVGRVLEELGYEWFEEPVQHYNLRSTGEVARQLDITVSAGEQSYTLQALGDLIDAGVKMIQPDIIKMGGVSGLVQAAALARSHGVEFVPHQMQPAIGHTANLHILAALPEFTRPAEFGEFSGRMGHLYGNLVSPADGQFQVPDGPGLGLDISEEEFAECRREIDLSTDELAA